MRAAVASAAAIRSVSMGARLGSRTPLVDGNADASALPLVSPPSPTFPVTPALSGLGSYVRASELRGAMEAARAAGLDGVEAAPLE